MLLKLDCQGVSKVHLERSVGVTIPKIRTNIWSFKGVGKLGCFLNSGSISCLVFLFFFPFALFLFSKQDVLCYFATSLVQCKLNEFK